MSQQIKRIDEVYSLIESLMSSCQKNNEIEIMQKLDNAMSLGSSGLEILGAIRQVLIENRNLINQMLSKNEVDQIILFIDRMFGR